MNVLQEAQLWRYAAALTANTLSGSDRAITLERWASHIHQVSILPRCTPQLLKAKCVCCTCAVLCSDRVSSHGMLAMHVTQRLQHAIALLGTTKSSLFHAATAMVSGQRKANAWFNIYHENTQTQHAQACELLPRLTVQCQPLCNVNAVEGASESPSHRCCAFTFSHQVDQVHCLFVLAISR